MNDYHIEWLKRAYMKNSEEMFKREYNMSFYRYNNNNNNSLDITMKEINDIINDWD